MVVRVVVVDVLHTSRSFLRFSPISHFAWVYETFLLPPFFVWFAGGGFNTCHRWFRAFEQWSKPIACPYPSSICPSTYHSLSIAVGCWVFFPIIFFLSLSRELSMFLSSMRRHVGFRNVVCITRSSHTRRKNNISFFFTPLHIALTSSSSIFDYPSSIPPRDLLLSFFCL